MAVIDVDSKTAVNKLYENIMDTSLEYHLPASVECLTRSDGPRVGK